VTGALPAGAWLCLCCSTLARLEIEIEGDSGWAAKLPTWRWEPEWFLNLTNGKAVTGYHVYLTALLLLFFHLPLVLAGWTRDGEAQALALYFLATVVWDFQWFLWNPAWGPRRFWNEPIPWFRRRIVGVPVDYVTGYLASWLSVRLLYPPLQDWWLGLAAIALGFTAATTLLALRRPSTGVSL
jgi:hypothetical protein